MYENFGQDFEGARSLGVEPVQGGSEQLRSRNISGLGFTHS
jgi:hypothetical protein